MGFFGKAQYHAEADNGWEPYTNLKWGQGDWSRIVERAERLGYSVVSDGDSVIMWKHGNDNGWFLKNGGQSMACEFLGGAA